MDQPVAQADPSPPGQPGPAADAPPATPPAGKPSQSLTPRQAILNAWHELFQSREKLLYRSYTRWNSALDADQPATRTLAEARQQYYAIQQQLPPSDFEREAWESKVVLGTRMVAAWMVFWTCALPAALLAWLSAIFLSEPGPLIPKLMIVLGLIVLAPVGCVLGLVVQSLFSRPFTYFMRWLLGAQQLPARPTVNRDSSSL